MASVRIPDQDLEQIDQFTRSRVGIGTLERHTGSSASEIQPYILLTNFMCYVDLFAIELGIRTLAQMQDRDQGSLGYQF